MTAGRYHAKMKRNVRLLEDSPRVNMTNLSSELQFCARLLEVNPLVKHLQLSNCAAKQLSIWAAIFFVCAFCCGPSSRKCSTSLPGGNQIDGLPPAASKIKNN